MLAPPRWSDTELLALWRRWPDYGAIAALTGRSRAAVRRQGHAEGLKPPRPKPCRPWTGREVTLLRKVWGTMTNRAATALFPGRTLRQVESQAYEIGCTMPERLAQTPLKATPWLIVNQIRDRARADGWSMSVLDREAGTRDYFQNRCRKELSLRKCLKALKVLDGELSVAWKD